MLRQWGWPFHARYCGRYTRCTANASIISSNGGSRWPVSFICWCPMVQSRASIRGAGLGTSLRFCSARWAWLARRSSLPPHLRSRYMTGYTAATLCRKSGASSLLLSRVWCPLVATGVFDLGDPHGDSVGFERVGVWQYALNQCVAITHYLRLMVWPHPLLLDYGPPKVLTRSTWPGKCYWWWRFCFVADGGWFAIWPFVFLCSWPPLRELYPLSRSGLPSAGFIWRRLVRRSWYCLRLIMAWSMYRVPVSG